MPNLNVVKMAYLEAVEFTECHDDNPEMAEASFSFEFMELAENDCRDFLALVEKAGLDGLPDDSRIGVDFWLTRNGHGAGFWDRGLGELGTKLTDIAHTFGSCEPYVGDNGQIYA